MDTNTKAFSPGVMINIPVYTFFSVALGMINVFGNSMTIIVICKRENLRTIQNMFILNLAVSDLIMACRILLEVFVSAGETNIMVCMWASVLWNISSIMSITSLVLIAADRFVYIFRSLHYYIIITRTRTIVVIASSWIITVILCLSDQIWRFWFDNTPICDFIFPLWFLISLFAIFILLNVTLLVFNGLLLQIALKQRKRIVNVFNGSNAAMLKTDYKFLKVIFIVVGFTEACWIPFLAVLAVNISGESRYSPTVMVYMGLAFYLNSALNFFIYAVRDKAFCNAYKSLLCIKW